MRPFQYLTFWVALDRAENRNFGIFRVSPSFLCPLFEKYVDGGQSGGSEEGVSVLHPDSREDEFWWETETPLGGGRGALGNKHLLKGGL